MIQILTVVIHSVLQQMIAKNLHMVRMVVPIVICIEVDAVEITITATICIKSSILVVVKLMLHVQPVILASFQVTIDIQAIQIKTYLDMISFAKVQVHYRKNNVWKNATSCLIACQLCLNKIKTAA